MGLGRIVFNLIFGPFLVWVLLMAHIGYHHGYQTPGPLPTSQWPEGFNAKEKDALISNRKAILKQVVGLMGSKSSEYEKFVKTHMTNDVVFEDPVQRFEGAEEVKIMFRLCQTFFDKVEVKVNNEIHSVHDMVVDWEFKFGYKWMPSWTMTIPLRSQFMFEPSGNAEQIFRLTDNWYGNGLITEKTAPFPLLGKIHQSWRRFSASTMVLMAEKGIL